MSSDEAKELKGESKIESLKAGLQPVKVHLEQMEVIIKAEPEETDSQMEQSAEEDNNDPLATLSEEEKVKVIKNAVKELELLDILVCGKCHSVYHFIEEFNEHKSSEKGCEENLDLREGLKEGHKKPQVWAFTLWKNTKFKSPTEEDKKKSSWQIYQTWRTLDQQQKKVWIKVSESIQKLCEIVMKFERAKIKVDSEKDHTEDEDDVKKDAKKDIVFTNTRKARRKGGDPDVEHLVEKFMSKRHNTRRRCQEYLVKWEKMDHIKNTWEAASALTNCKQMMDDFDKKFQAQREQIRLQKIVEKKALNTSKADMYQNSSVGRPQRTSKQKALNQVKAWCGNIESDMDGKRVFSDDSDEDESFDKRMRMDEESSESETEKPTSSSKGGGGTKSFQIKSQNGVEPKRTTTITLPENILIPDEKGIVRINQKHIPSLSSGVYVMSKTAGIIKLDTDASKLATTVGHKILKVTSKTGQTSVRVIKKEVSNGSGGQGKGAPAPIKTIIKPAVRNYSGKVYMQKRTTAQATAQAKKSQTAEKKDEEDESDGVPEMEFPEEIQLPTADSPPPDFSLCPLTGKVLDKDGNIMDAEDSPVQSGEKNKGSKLDLVNIAAADILDDLGINNKNIKVEHHHPTTNTTRTAATSASSPSVTTTVARQAPQGPPPPRVVQKTTIITSTGSRVVQQVVQQAKAKLPTNSILSTALTSANIVRRGPPKLVPRSSPRPAIISAPMVRAGTPRMQTVVTRITPTTAMASPRTRIRPGTQIIRKRIVQTSPHQVMAQQQHHQQQQQANRNVVRKVQMPAPKVNTYVVAPTTTKLVHHAMPPLIDSQSNRIVTETKTTTSTVEKATSSATQSKPAATPKKEVTSSSSSASTTATTSDSSNAPQTQTISLTDSDTPLLITGEDGTIYQVAGQNEDGQTILITQGEDGEQQCLLVAPENAALINQAIMKPGVQQQQSPPQRQEPAPPPQQQVVEQQEEADDSQVVAQIVSANPPSPGGTRKVVLMLPDGNYMMTEVTADQYAALELDK